MKINGLDIFVFIEIRNEEDEKVVEMGFETVEDANEWLKVELLNIPDSYNMIVALNQVIDGLNVGGFDVWDDVEHELLNKEEIIECLEASYEERQPCGFSVKKRIKVDVNNRAAGWYDSVKYVDEDGHMLTELDLSSEKRVPWYLKKCTLRDDENVNNIDEIVHNNDKHYYVCRKCFNKYRECECEKLPDSLIMIDEYMLPIIKILNEKWYFTKHCCNGHFYKEEKMAIIVFSLGQDFKKMNLPSGWHTKRGTDMNYYYKSRDEISFVIEREKVMKELFEWAEELPRNPWGCEE